MRRFSLFFMAALVMPVVLASCSGAGKPEAEGTRPKANDIRKEYRKGPFSVRLVADKDAINIAESVVLTIEAEMEDGYEAELPRFGEQLSEFGIRDYREDQPQLTPQGRIITRKTYTLDPFLSGDYTIAPMQVRFHKKAEGAAAAQAGSPGGGSDDHEITTEDLTIRVNSLLEKDQKELAINPIKGPVGLPLEPISPWYALLALGVVTLAASGGFLWMRRKRSASRQDAAAALPAHALAYRQLQEIFDEKLLERGEFKLFFSKISDVLRFYVENRFGLHAPKRTTEEFLGDISREAPFSAEQRGILAEFLRNCDLVKFAEHHPSQEEIERAINSCKAFIEATKAQPVEES